MNAMDRRIEAAAPEVDHANAMLDLAEHAVRVVAESGYGVQLAARLARIDGLPLPQAKPAAQPAAQSGPAPSRFEWSAILTALRTQRQTPETIAARAIVMRFFNPKPAASQEPMP